MSGRNIEHILLAEFDIDKGSTLKHQIPGPIPNYADDFLADRMLPDGAQNQEWDWTLFFLNREVHYSNRASADDMESWEVIGNEERGRAKQMKEVGKMGVNNKNERDDEKPLYCLTLIHCRKDETVRRGATIRSIAICSRLPFVNVFRPLLFRALQEYFHEEDVGVLQCLYSSINNTDLSRQKTIISNTQSFAQYSSRPLYSFFVPSSAESASGQVALEHGQQFIFEEPLRVPLHHSKDQFDEISVRDLLRKFKAKGVVYLYMTVLMGYRLLVMGHNVSTSDICQSVLSIVGLVCPPLSGILMERAFPYVSLTDVIFQDVDGFIAGTTNPYFKEKCDWDVLADLESGKVVIRSPKVEQLITGQVVSSMSEKSTSGLRLFASKLDSYSRQSLAGPSAVATYNEKLIKLLKKGLALDVGEAWLRRRFQENTLNLLDAALGPAIKPLVPEKQKAADQLSAVHKKIRETLAFQRYEQWVKSGFRIQEQPDDDEGSDQTRTSLVLHHIKQLQQIVEGEKDGKPTSGDPSSLDVIFANLLALVQTKRQYSDFLSLLCLYLGDADLESFLARIASEPLRLQTSIFFSRLLAFKSRMLQGEE